MAEINDDLARQMEELRREMQGLESATKASTVGLNAFGKATAAGAKDLSKGLSSFAMQVGKGDTSFKSLNSVVDIASDALAGMAKAIPFAGEAVAAGLKAAAEGAKFMLEQLDQTTRAFNDLSKVGGLTATGMSGLQEQFLKSGLTLQTYTKVVGENSQALARMSGMVGKGADALVGVTEHFTNLTGKGDDALRKLGLSSEDIAQTTGAFLTQQTRLGRSQSMTTEQLIAGTKAYTVELDGLQKATGLSRDAIMKQQDAALSESRFRGIYQTMMENGQEGAAKELMSFQSIVSGVSKEAGKGIRDLATGAVTSAEAQALVTATNGKAIDIQERLTSGQITSSQAMGELQAAIKENKGTLLEQARYNKDAAASFGDIPGLLDLQAAKFDASGKQIKETQDAQINKTDDLTKSTIDAQKNMEGLNREMNKLGFTFLPEAAKATEAVTKALKGLVQFINEKVLGQGGAGGAAAAGPSATGSTGTGMDMGGGEIMAAAEGGAPAAAPSAGGKMSQSDLSSMGLKIKKGDVQAEGSQISGQLIDLAKRVQAEIPGFGYFSGFNDQYHQDKKGGSNHTKGRAFDFVLAQPPTREEGAKIVSMLKSMGASYALDEYANLSAGGTGGHIHAEVSAANGAILSGPSGGYQPNLTMHGTEAVVPLDKPSAAVNAGLAPSQDILMAQLSKLDEMVSVLKSQLSVNSKILAYQS